MSKADRLPRWAFRRLSDKQKEAHNQLVWYGPGPAERARLKKVLGWRRSRTETIALANELLEQGRSRSQAAAEIGINVRYLDGLLQGEATPRNRAEKASISRDVVSPIGEIGPVVPPR